ncbi:uncharacterized protein BDZ99DRAFT_576715 [Mytilinidion resinicola]|uniref:RING-type domain-containing protein n=1 Tax=Mytilinidion resinicola TaxID=574789 RepID=A0A6A6Y477_9PEZI|nr:uncharacterized protein BDZ99DRAFT_576715 [Mytilinidion resinicola]KAF2802597.1 hypothetical protein BDZ99DRAFT_576715 [Mytilinidion resinicola]
MDDRMPSTLEEFLQNHVLEIPTECQICFEGFDTGNHTAVLATSNPRCHHVFGLICLIKWLKSDFARKKECPVCTNVFYQSEPISMVLRLRRIQAQLDAIGAAVAPDALPTAGPVDAEFSLAREVEDYLLPQNKNRILGVLVDGLHVDAVLFTFHLALFNSAALRALRVGLLACLQDATIASSTGHPPAIIASLCTAVRDALEDPFALVPVPPVAWLAPAVAALLVPDSLGNVIVNLIHWLNASETSNAFAIALLSPAVVNAYRASLLARLEDPTIAEATGRPAASIEELCINLRAALAPLVPVPVADPVQNAVTEAPIVQAVPASSVEAHLSNLIPDDQVDDNLSITPAVIRVLTPALLGRGIDAAAVEALNAREMHVVDTMIDPARLRTFRAMMLDDATLSEQNRAEFLAANNAAAREAPVVPASPETPRAAVAPVQPTAEALALRDTRFIPAMESRAIADVYFRALMGGAVNQGALDALNALDPRIATYILDPVCLQASRIRFLAVSGHGRVPEHIRELIRAAYDAAALENPVHPAAPAALVDNAPDLPVLGFALNVFFGIILGMVVVIMIAGAIGILGSILEKIAGYQP